MKLCKDCKFFKAAWTPVFEGQCNQRTRPDLVWGGEIVLPISARIERDINNERLASCGPEATYWERAPVVEAVPESKAILKPWWVRLLNPFKKFL